MSNRLVLSFAGEPTDLSNAFKSVGKDAEQMGDTTEHATRRMAEGFDNASMQSSMLSGGIGDVGGAMTAAFGDDTALGQFGAQLETVGTVIMGVTGLSDLLLFATNNLRLGQLRMAAASKIQAAAQWISNTAMLASPLTWIILAVIALVAAIVLIATKTDWFSRAWRASWKWIKDAAANTWEFVKKIPGWTAQAFSKIADFITRPYRAAFNGIARAWNATIGRLSWSVPGWVPVIGGNTISVPNLPTFHSGGIIPGVVGTAVPFMGIAGERVSGIASRGGGGSDAPTLVAAGDELVRVLLERIAAEVQSQGGDAATVGIRLR
jgi:hypothetical protein